MPSACSKNPVRVPPHERVVARGPVGPPPFPGDPARHHPIRSTPTPLSLREPIAADIRHRQSVPVRPIGWVPAKNGRRRARSLRSPVPLEPCRCAVQVEEPTREGEDGDVAVVPNTSSARRTGTWLGDERRGRGRSRSGLGRSSPAATGRASNRPQLRALLAGRHRQGRERASRGTRPGQTLHVKWPAIGVVDALLRLL
jgi:hypothetical protein